VLEGEADGDRAAHRDLEAGGGCLLVERGLRVADEQAHQPVGLGLLDVLDGLAELGDAQRDQLLADDLAAIVGDKLLRPLGRDLAEVIIGGDGVDLLAVSSTASSVPRTLGMVKSAISPDWSSSRPILIGG
jgi:hypothetical protein